MTTPERQSIREFWNDASRNRRHSPGRREDDYAVCSQHYDIIQGTKDRICQRDAAMTALKEMAEAALKKHESEANMKFKDLWDAVISIRDQIVGKFTFRVVLSFVGIVVLLIGVSNSFLLHKMAKDIDDLQTSVTTLVTENRFRGK